jgi:hypothetical protein
MIPGDVAHFLESATVAMGGSRDKNLVPHVHKISGWAVGSDQKTLTCLISQGFTEDLIPSLENNAQFALTVCEVPSHETYQFKGTCLGSRAVNESDQMIYEQFQRRFAERVHTLFGFPEDLVRAFIPPPSMVLDLAVQEIFVQTPGPRAGRRLFPEQ